ncbi:MAG: cyclic nucleotide-binding domain-containing protein [Planctomycetota bacterium]
MNQEYFHSLRRLAVFAGMSDHSLHMLVFNAQLIERAPHASFYEEGQQGDCFYVLLEGAVELSLPSPRGNVLLTRMYEGDCFGEMSLLDLMPRSTNATAINDSFALEIDRKSLHSLFNHDLEQYAIIMMNMGREVSRRMRVTEKRVIERAKPAPYINMT